MLQAQGPPIRRVVYGSPFHLHHTQGGRSTHQGKHRLVTAGQPPGNPFTANSPHTIGGPTREAPGTSAPIGETCPFTPQRATERFLAPAAQVRPATGLVRLIAPMVILSPVAPTLNLYPVCYEQHRAGRQAPGVRSPSHERRTCAFAGSVPRFLKGGILSIRCTSAKAVLVSQGKPMGWSFTHRGMSSWRSA